MLGFWIIITHLIGAYLTTSEYVQTRAAHSTTFAIGMSFLYIIPFLLFLPSSPLSFAAVLIFRFVIVRFSLVDYLIWARNVMAPKDERVERVSKEGRIDMDSASNNQLISLHASSIAVHCLFIALAIIVL